MAVDITKLRGMSPVELEKEELALREEIWKLRLQRSTGQLQDGQRVRRKRHDLARVMTVKTENSRAAAQGE